MHEYLYDGKLPEWIAQGPTLEDAMRNAGGTRVDYLASLYTYCEMLPSGAKVVEVGTNLGESTIVMGHALKKKGGTLFSIDPVFITGHYWCPDDGNVKDGMNYQSSLEDMFMKLKGNKLISTVTIIPGFSVEILNVWDCPLDAIFVDAEHTYKAVQEDCGWLQWVKPGGLAIFDDWFREVSNAVKDYIKDKPQWTILHESTSAPENNMVVTLLRRTG